MPWPAQLLMTVVVVAGGILVYDAVRPDATPAEPPAGSAERPAAPQPGPRAESPEIRLVGNPAELADRLAALEKRVAVIAATKGAGAAGGVEEDSRGAVEKAGESGAAVSAEPEPGSAQEKKFDEREIARFRAYMEEVDRRRREEMMTTTLRTQLRDQLKLTLSDQQEKSVIAETLAFQNRVRDTWRAGLPMDEQGRQERMAQVTKLREEWSQTIYQLVPASDAEKITTSLGRGGVMGGRGEFGPGFIVPTPPTPR